VVVSKGTNVNEIALNERKTLLCQLLYIGSTVVYVFASLDDFIPSFIGYVNFPRLQKWRKSD
jgi:hypothetical protein